MFCRVLSATVIGIEASIIEVEVDLRRGLPGLSIVGLPDPAVREARERVQAAIRNSDHDFPLGSITVNLAPASLRKVGSTFDLAIALGIIGASPDAGFLELDSFLVLGELSLDGTVRPVRGVIAALRILRESRISRVILPAQNMDEALLLPGPALFPVRDLKEAVEILKSDQKERLAESPVAEESIQASRHGGSVSDDGSVDEDFADVRGQAYAIRAVEIAAAGGHNLLLIGPPGSGKSMIASRIPTVLPPMTKEESIVTTTIYSVAGLLSSEKTIMVKRPFRSPHHTASDVSIVGGGRSMMPGEITLAHNGVLFFDEFAEFRNNILQSLRQPLESGRVHLSRADFRLTFPADFMLVAAMNPCPCGYLFDERHRCRCSPRALRRYFAKLSGPLLDRIDIQVPVKPLGPEDLLSGKSYAPSSVMGRRIAEARSRQLRRNGRSVVNGRLKGGSLRASCMPDGRVRDLIVDAAKRFGLSARSCDSVLRVARTISDLDGRESIREEDVLEALSYREVERIFSGLTVGAVPG
jgi:magnesium chelatase family protein